MAGMVGFYSQYPQTAPPTSRLTIPPTSRLTIPPTSVSTTHVQQATTNLEYQQGYNNYNSGPRPTKFSTERSKSGAWIQHENEFPDSLPSGLPSGRSDAMKVETDSTADPPHFTLWHPCLICQKEGWLSAHVCGLSWIQSRPTFNRDLLAATRSLIPAEFETKWQAICDEFGDDEGKVSKYLRRLYNDRFQWAWPWVRTTFTAGMQTTQRIEKTHHLIKMLGVNSKTPLSKVLKATSLKVDKEHFRARCSEDAKGGKATIEHSDRQLPPTMASRMFPGIIEIPIQFCKVISNAEDTANEPVNDAREVSLVTLLSRLKQEQISVVFFTKDKIDSDVQEYVVILTDNSYFCTCLLLQNLGIVCRHFFCAMQGDSRCKYHISLVLKRWFKEELQDRMHLKTVTSSETFQVASPHRNSISSTRKHPDNTYMENVHTLFSSESSIPPTNKRLNQRKRRTHNDAATVEELASLPSLELEIKSLDNKIQRLENRLQQITKLSASPVIKPPVASSSSSEHTERKLVLDDIIPRYGKYSSASLDQSRKSYRVISNAMEFLDVFHSRAFSIHGDNFLTVCSRLLSLAILEDAERQRVENALMALPAAERTWEVCEQTFIHELKTAHQRTRDVIEAVKAGMVKGESYKHYAWRLERINRIYKISGSASEEQVVSLLELSISAAILTQLHFHFSSVNYKGTGARTFQRIATIKDFCKSLVIVEGPDDCDDRRQNR
ncbi:hypothetical protein BGX27_003689, partial [Mortierella sp. AM989]